VGSSYISHFICSYNLNDNLGPLRGPSIILIIFHRLRSKYMRQQMVVFNAATKSDKTAMVPHNKTFIYIIYNSKLNRRIAEFTRRSTLRIRPL